MFVRWRFRRFQYHDDPHHYFFNSGRLNATLIENRRVDGEVKQQHIAFLGSAVVRKGNMQVGYRDCFWRSANKRLDELADRIGPEERQRIEAALLERVSPPTDEEREEEAASLAALIAKFKAPVP
jgi:hypothetical protein